MTDAEQTPSPRADRKADRLHTHCLYQIATGKWPEGERMPSVREAERRWGVDRRTVLTAYHRLAEAGLVRRVDRSGFFVASGPELGRLSLHRAELEEIYGRVREELERDTGFSTLAAFRYFAELASIRAAERPECAFVECTLSQATEHAAEVSTRLGVPCLPITLEDLGPAGGGVPKQVRVLLVSRFHMGEVGTVAQSLELRSVPIEVTPELRQALPQGAERGVVFESDEEEAHQILTDVSELSLGLELSSRTVEDPNLALAEHFGQGEQAPLALLSPRLWGTLSKRWRDSSLVVQIAFRVREEAWPGIADSMGLPLGTFG